MRKLLMTVALASAFVFANAQTLTTKEGNAVLPEEGDWSFSIDAAPLGTWFRDSGPSALTNQYLQNMTIVGKMVKANGKALRGKLRIGFGNDSQDALSLATGSATATVTDTRKNSSMNVTLGAGVQQSRGKGRVQGYYGGEAFIMFGSSSTDYTYGNAITTTAQTPNRHDFGGNIDPTGTIYATKDKSGSTFGFGVRGFVGMEYFFAAKMSLGAEYGWGLALNSTGEGQLDFETYDAATSGPKSDSAKTGGNSTFNLDVDNASGAIFMSFYF